MDKIAAYEMLISEHPLWEDVYYHDKEAGLSSVLSGMRTIGTTATKDLGAFTRGVGDAAKGFSAGVRPAKGIPNTLKSRIERGMMGALPGVQQAKNTVTGNLFGQLGQDLAYSM
jgi:hypothetical protein